MSFNAQSIAAPYFVLGAILLIVLAPGYVEEGAPSFAFWTAAGVGCPFFFFAYLGAASAQGDPGTGFCCGVILLGPLAGLAAYAWELHPVAKALLPWGVLLAGPLLVTCLWVAGWAARRLHELRARAALIRIARGGARDALLPHLLDGNRTVRDAALQQLDAFAPDPPADVALLQACFEHQEQVDDDVLDRLTRKVLARSTPPRDRLLALYTIAPSDGAADALERSLTGLTWSEHGGLAPLLAAARERLRLGFGRAVDGVVRLAGEAAHPEAVDLATAALAAGAVNSKTVLELGHEKAAASVAGLIALQQTEGGQPTTDQATPVLFALPSRLALPLLAQLLTRWPVEGMLDVHLGLASRRLPEAFGDAHRAPEAAAAVLAALDARAAQPGSTGGSRYEDLAAMIQRGLDADPSRAEG